MGTRRSIATAFQLLDIEGDGFHVMISGKINGKEAHFLIDTGASRSVFDTDTISCFIDTPLFQKKEGITAGLGSSDMESATFDIERLELGPLPIEHYEAVALDLSNIHSSYEQLRLPRIHGIIGGDLLVRYKAVINYRQRKIRFTPKMQKKQDNK